MQRFMSTSRSVRLLYVGLLLCLAPFFNSCASNTPDNKNIDNPPEDQRVQVPTPPTPDKGVQFVQPETIIKAGEEKMICWIPSWVPEKDYFINNYKATQGKMGHHVVSLNSNIPRKAGSSFDCSNIEQMTSLQPLLIPLSENKSLMPPGFAIRLPKGSKIVIQSHYVNTSDKDIRVADVAQLFFATEEKPTLASYLVLNHGTAEVKTGENTLTVDCKIQSPLKLLLVLGHMHESGLSIKAELLRNGQTLPLYEVAKWDVEYRDIPPITHFSPEKPKELQTGDIIRLHCAYNNKTGKDLRFPAEMCSLLATYFPARTQDNGLIICNEKGTEP